MIISPSILSADFAKLGEEVRSLETAGADWAHIDVMDGAFVPNITIGIPVIKSLRPYTKMPFDVHLMINEPLRYVGDFVKAGADIFCFHIEAESTPGKTIDAVTAAGAKPAIALKPSTPADSVFPYINDLFMVLVMTVEPGFGGQSFMADMLPKIREIRKKAPDIHIQVDGGINAETGRLCAEAGADVLVAGSYIFGAADRAAAIRSLRC